MKEKIKDILSKLTLEEKAGLCSGSNFWNLKSVPRLGLEKIMLTDGPHGLRKQEVGEDHIGLNISVAATCFPTASATASSWDEELMFEMGQALSEECLKERVSVILGPGANIKRSPLCGRNFEYISEDPYLTGKMAAALIRGVQSNGVGTSLKHYVMNNQEDRRMVIDAVVDERTQREIYLKGFEIAVKESQPWTVMCSYNKVDDTYLACNKRLLTDILKNEWGHSGLVVTDWGAIKDRVEGIKAGVELEMPSSNGKNDDKIVAAVKEGRLTMEELDKSVVRVIEMILKSQDNLKEEYQYDKQAHHNLARKIAANSAVLLKNNGVLPIKKNTKIAIIGEFAKNPRYQGAGSSRIKPLRLDSICDELDTQKIDYTYSQGYSAEKPDADVDLLMEAKRNAKNAEVAIVFVGLTEEFESEGFDRTSLDIPENHTELVKAVLKENKNTIVVLQNGGPVTMPWINDAAAVLECYLGGQAGSGAAIDLLFGDVNPSGKLAETFPYALEDNPSYLNFPGSKLTVEHRESIYVGYRYYDKANKEVLFPFGHGLSYTRFEYTDMSVNNRGDKYQVSFKVKNIGDFDGAEVVQLYIENAPSTLFKAEKELRAFDKVFLKKGESKIATLLFNSDAFSYYNVNISDWHVEGGEYNILVGASSRDIKLREKVSIKENIKAEVPDYTDALSEYYNLKDEVLDISDNQFQILYGKELPKTERESNRPFDQNTMLGDIRGTFIGNILLKKVYNQLKGLADDSDDGVFIEKMLKSMMETMPLWVIGMFAGDKLPKYFIESLILFLNRSFFKGILMLLKK